MVNILVVHAKRPNGGVRTFMINYQSHFKGKDVHLDYLFFDDELNGEFDEIVKSMGSSVYILPKLKHRRIFSLQKAINNFFFKKW